MVGAGFAGLLLWHKLQRGRLHRRPLLREGRRRRRHLVLEPLSGHRLRRRVLQLPAAARGDGLRPDDEVRVGLRDPRVLPDDGREVRLLRPLPVPHHGRADRVGRGSGRWTVYTDRGDAHAGAVRDPGQRHPHQPEAGPHRGHGDVPGRVLPHVALELQRRPARASGSASSAPAPPPCRPSPSWPRSSKRALRLPAHAVHHRRARPAGHHARRRSSTWANEPGWARARRARFAKISAGRTAHARPTTTTWPARSPTSRSASSTSGELTPEELIAEAARLQLPDHGADPRPGRRHRRGPEDGGGAEAVLPVRLQAADVPRRVPADVQPAARAPRRHRADGRAARSTSAASCTTASSTRSTS